MKFKIARSSFQEVLGKVMNTVPTKPTMQILSNVLISVEDGGRMHVMASNLDQSVEAETTCECSVPGSSTLPAKLLFGIVQKLVDGVVSVEVDDSDRGVISCGTSVFKVSGMRSTDFPKLPEVETVQTKFVISQASLKSMLKKTSYAACADETRRSLAGVCLSVSNGVMSLIATDGRRLALAEEKIETAPAEDTEFILTKNSAKELVRLLGSEGTVSIYSVSSQVFFELNGGTKIITKVVDEKYPPARNVIPDVSEGHECISIDRQSLLNSIERVSVFIDDAFPSVLLAFRGNELLLSANSSSSDYAARDSLPVKYDGTKIDIKFNPNYVLDVLKAVNDDEIKFYGVDGNHPAVVKADGTYVSVLMPLRGV